MLLFDTLSLLESYLPSIPQLSSVIAVMDHATPYDDDPGRYVCREGSSEEYVVSVHLSSERGFPGENYPGKIVVEIVLEGDEIVSVDGSVFRLVPGRFLVYEGEREIKRGVMHSTPVAFKTVRFLL